MTNDNFKQILDKSIEPLQHGIDELKKGQEEFRKDLNGVKENQAELKKIVEEQVLPPVAYIEATIKSYADRYVANADHIGRLDKRLGAVEENLGIQPPEELTIPRFD